MNWKINYMNLNKDVSYMKKVLAAVVCLTTILCLLTGCSLADNAFIGTVVEVDSSIVGIQIEESGNTKLQPTKYVLIELKDVPDVDLFIGDRVKVEFDSELETFRPALIGTVLEHPTKIKKLRN